VWDLNTGTCMHTLDKHNAFVLGLQFDDTRMVQQPHTLTSDRSPLLFATHTDTLSLLPR